MKSLYRTLRNCKLQFSFLGRSITIRLGHNECHYMVVPYLECPLSSTVSVYWAWSLRRVMWSWTHGRDSALTTALKLFLMSQYICREH